MMKRRRNKKGKKSWKMNKKKREGIFRAWSFVKKTTHSFCIDLFSFANHVSRAFNLLNNR